MPVFDPCGAAMQATIVLVAEELARFHSDISGRGKMDIRFADREVAQTEPADEKGMQTMQKCFFRVGLCSRLAHCVAQQGPARMGREVMIDRR